MPIDPLATPDDPIWDTTAEEDALRGTPAWNVSRHEPWWRAWLLSWQLFATYRDHLPRVGVPLDRVLGGTIYEYRPENLAIWVQVWVAQTELLVVYPMAAPAYALTDPPSRVAEFDGWIADLRNISTLELGRTRDVGCPYGAVWAGDPAVPPVVKWAAAGDWAALARNWYIESVTAAANARGE